MSSSPPFTSAQPRGTLLETEVEDLSSDDSLYETSGTDTEQFEKKPTKRSGKRPSSTGKLRRGSSTGGDEPPLKKSIPHSTWLSRTAPDRAISDSLDQSRARDLSIHLYNAHALKRRARLAKLTPEGSRNKDSLWQPPKHWTAWPLPRNEVPQVKKAIWADVEDDEKTWRSLDYPNSRSGELCEQLLGVVLKTAKERFLAEDFNRETDNNSTPHGRTSSNHASASTSRAATETEASVSGSDEDFAEELKGTSPKQPSRCQSEDSLYSDEVNPDSINDHAIHHKSKDSGKIKQPNRPVAPSDDPRLQSLKPVIMADEEVARSILQPSIHHIISKLDTLLMGLHHARRASQRVNDDSASETHTDPDDDQSQAPTRAQSRSRSTHSRKRIVPRRQPSQSRSRAPSEAADSGMSTSESRSSSRPPAKRARRSSSPASKARRTRRQRARLGLRDWSDVLGIAAMQGWDREVIDAAAKRCAALFQEGMDFRVVDGLEVDEFSYLPVGMTKKPEGA
ncbi:hypothetical protein MMC26_007609 [Xylographa opegraphella]|nr:hypothetical protein [Xylographa opegraphella]